MKKSFVALVLASLVSLVSLVASGRAETVPVEVGEARVTITIPLVVNDMDVVIQAFADSERTVQKNGEIATYCVRVFYPNYWGVVFAQHHIGGDGKGAGLYTLTFEQGESVPSRFSFTINLKNPLSNFGDSESDRKKRAEYAAALGKALGKDMKSLTLAPSLWLVEWTPADSTELRRVMSRNNPEDDLLITEKVVLPPQVGGQPPCTIQKVGIGWDVNRDRLTNLVSLTELAPFLASVKESPIRVKEGFLKRGSDPDSWVIFKNKMALINVVMFTEYSVAVRQ